MIQASTTNSRREIERCVLGAMLLSSDAAEIAFGELAATTFSNADLRAMFTAVCEMLESGIECDPVTLGNHLAKRGELVNAGGALGIADVMDAVPHSGHIRHYVRQLVELHQRDCLGLLSDRLRRRAEDLSTEPSEIISIALNELESLRIGDARKLEFKTASEALRDADERVDDPAKIVQTGLSELDRQLRGGMRAGQLIVVGGRPGAGKSVLMDQIILNAGRHHRPGLIVSLEMKTGEITERGLQKIDRSQFAALPVLFSECSEFSKIVALIRLLKRRHAIQIVAVDYLQLIDSPIGRGELRERQVATVSRGLKRLAMELEIPILLGSQLNRESEKRGRPSLADLRESGAIEQDADIVILINGDVETDQRELIVAKQRGGPCGMVRATFDRPQFWFSDGSSEPWTGKL